MNKKITVKHVIKSLLLAAIVAMSVVSCLFLDNVTIYNEAGEEVEYGEVGKKLTFVIKGHLSPRSNVTADGLVMAMLVPRSWDLAHNADVTYTLTRYTEDYNHRYKMSVIPEGSLPKNGEGMTWSDRLKYVYGIGPNVLDDMEWVAFQSDDSWDVVQSLDGDITVYVVTTPGTENLRCRLGFFFNHTDHGCGGMADNDDQKSLFTDYCFEVVGGDNPVVDFCNNHYNKISPMSSLQNDFVTFTFNSDAANNELAGGEVYLQGTAYSTSGKAYAVTEKSEKTRMHPSETGGKDYNLMVWPVDFFNVPVDEELEYIDYTFCNADGSVVIGKSDDDFDQYGTERPAQRVPFRYTFTCR